MNIDTNLDQQRTQMRNHAVLALVLFSFLNFINQVDRRALTTLFPLLKAEWQLTDTQLGLAASFFSLARTLITIPAGWLADKKGEIRVLQPIVLLWSLLTLVTGWTGKFNSFLAVRLGVSFMDGANGPLDISYLGKVSPQNRRGLFLSVYSIALYLGSGLGVIFAAAIGEQFGWRWVFMIPGILGLIAAAGFFLLPRKPLNPIEQENIKSNTKYSFLWLKQKPLPGIFIGAAFGVFASTALVSWLPTYLTRQFSISLSQAGLITGGVIIPGSILGTLIGGLLSDRQGKNKKYARSVIASFGLSMAMVFGVTGLGMKGTWSSILFFSLTAISMTLPVSPLLVMVQEAVHDKKLATTQATFGLITQVVGAAPATLLVGLLSDLVGLRLALILPFIIAGLGAMIIFIFTGENK